MARTDYAFPFRIDPVSGQAPQAAYAAHVDQMIRQVLLTAPGERVDLPEFGCGLRQLLFAPNSDRAAGDDRRSLVQQRSRPVAGRPDRRCRASTSRRAPAATIRRSLVDHRLRADRDADRCSRPRSG